MTGKRTRTRGPGGRAPIRDNRAGLLVCMPDYSWTKPLQVNAARPEHQGRRAKYGAPVLAAFTLLGRSRALMPHDADGAFMQQASDSSPRLRLLSSRGTPSPGQTVSVTEGEPPPPGRPGHSGTYRRIGAQAKPIDWSRRTQQIFQLWAVGSTFGRVFTLFASFPCQTIAWPGGREVPVCEHVTGGRRFATGGQARSRCAAPGGHSDDAHAAPQCCRDDHQPWPLPDDPHKKPAPACARPRRPGPLDGAFSVHLSCRPSLDRQRPSLALVCGANPPSSFLRAWTYWWFSSLSPLSASSTIPACPDQTTRTAGRSPGLRSTRLGAVPRSGNGCGACPRSSGSPVPRASTGWAPGGDGAR
jgi:hypothetical protein